LDAQGVDCNRVCGVEDRKAASSEGWRRREASYWYKPKAEMKIAPSTPTVSIAATMSSPVTCGGQGCWIDSSQAEVGIFLTGASILDHSANGRSWARHGNRSPYKQAAPHGAYRARGEDR
jgi:hypothetical protein